MISKKSFNQLNELVNTNKTLSLNQKNILYENGEKNYESIKELLMEGLIYKPNQKYNAIQILYILRGFKGIEEFLEVVLYFIEDEDIKIRSCCFNLLIILAAENLRGLTHEIDENNINQKVIPALKKALNKGVLPNSLEFSKKHVDINL